MVSDDTDVFVLLLHHYDVNCLNITMTMESPSTSKNKTVTDIQLTVEKNKNIIKNILPAHAISGCDTVATYFGIGKGKVIKVLREGCELTQIGQMDASIDDVVLQATRFISSCYGIKDTENMTETRIKVWAKKHGQKKLRSLNLASLPPTTASFIENIKRAHFQAIMWKNVDNYPQFIDPEHFGWEKKEESKSLSPRYFQNSTKPAPDYILNLIRCGCKSEPPCSSKKCSCHQNGLACTNLCACFNVGCIRSIAD